MTRRDPGGEGEGCVRNCVGQSPCLASFVAYIPTWRDWLELNLGVRRWRRSRRRCSAARRNLRGAPWFDEAGWPAGPFFFLYGPSEAVGRPCDLSERGGAGWFAPRRLSTVIPRAGGPVRALGRARPPGRRTRAGGAATHSVTRRGGMGGRLKFTIGHGAMSLLG
jgi:hypothetical protein